MSTHNQTTDDDTHQTGEETNPTTRVRSMLPPPAPSHHSDERKVVPVPQTTRTHNRQDWALDHIIAIEGVSTVLMSNTEIFNQLSTLISTIESMATRVKNIERETQTLQNNYERQANELNRPHPTAIGRHRPRKEPIIEKPTKQRGSGKRRLVPQEMKVVREDSKPSLQGG